VLFFWVGIVLFVGLLVCLGRWFFCGIFFVFCPSRRLCRRCICGCLLFLFLLCGLFLVLSFVWRLFNLHMCVCFGVVGF